MEHTFAIHAPHAREVFLAGEMTQWNDGKLRMHRRSDGTWQQTLHLEPGQWVYKFVVDGRWVPDPASPHKSSDGSGGHHSSVLLGHGPWSHNPDIPHGQIRHHAIMSQAWKHHIGFHIYLPPGYDDTGIERYPLAVFLHGQGMDEQQWVDNGLLATYMDNLIANGIIQPFIAVMPSSESVPYVDASERHILHELLPRIRQELAVRTDPAGTAVIGMSMGGFGAFYLGLRYPDVFGLSVPISGYFGYFDGALLRSLPGEYKPELTVYCGLDDYPAGIVASNQELCARLRDRGVRFDYLLSPGGHTWRYWNGIMPDVLTRVSCFFQQNPWATSL